MSAKPKFPRAVALAVARELVGLLADACLRIEIAGSLRREKPFVGDVELVYVPRTTEEPDGLFDRRRVCLVARLLDTALVHRHLAKRRTVTGSEVWGPKNKLAVHVASGVPVDLFTATEANWFNYLVCRTGGKFNNMAIASAARRRGLEWHPYDRGFTDREGNWLEVRSEREVFDLAGVPYWEPWERE